MCDMLWSRKLGNKNLVCKLVKKNNNENDWGKTFAKIRSEYIEALNWSQKYQGRHEKPTTDREMVQL